MEAEVLDQLWGLPLGTLAPGSFLESLLLEPLTHRALTWEEAVSEASGTGFTLSRRSLGVVGRDPAFCVSSDTDHCGVLGWSLYLWASLFF